MSDRPSDRTNIKSDDAAGRPSATQGNPPELTVGFVPLLDAAPIIVAYERGYFTDEGLRVSLARQLGWGNVRAKLTYGQLHASHALIGMAPESLLETGGTSEALVAVMRLGAGGNAITLAKPLINAGVTTPGAMARYLKTRQSNRPAMLAHVFPCSTHHYLLRHWLSQGGIDADRDLRLCVLPPPQMVRQLARGYLDGFCVGEPWNSYAELEGVGEVVAWTNHLVPNHADKVLAVSRNWLTANAEVAEALVRAVLRGCQFCSHLGNADAVAEILEGPQYLGTPRDVIARSLAPSRKPVWACEPGDQTYPATADALWILGQMKAYRHLPPNTDVNRLARLAVDAGPYRRAAAALGVPVPAIEPAAPEVLTAAATTAAAPVKESR